jgi:hypothetical protein
MTILGPNGFERSYTLVGNAEDHQPLVIANVLLNLAAGDGAGPVKGSCNHECAVWSVVVRVALFPSALGKVFPTHL